VFLSQQHTLNSLSNEYHSKKAKSHWLLINLLIKKQCSKIKSLIVDSNNCLNKVFFFFDRLHKELSPDFHLVDIFPGCFLFHIVVMVYLSFYILFWFYFIFIHFFWFDFSFSFILFWFYFWDNEETCDHSHMMHHMI